MNFKLFGKKNKENKDLLEKEINRGIKLFNDTNNMEIPLLNETEYGTEIEGYDFFDDYFVINWKKDEGTCGEEYYEEYSQKIPYEYFESTEEEKERQDKIQKDKIERANLKKRIEKIKKEISEYKEELNNIERDLRDYLRIQNKYKKGSGYVYGQNIEENIKREITKLKGAIYIKEDELQELENEK